MSPPSNGFYGGIFGNKGAPWLQFDTPEISLRVRAEVKASRAGYLGFD